MDEKPLLEYYSCYLLVLTCWPLIFPSMLMTCVRFLISDLFHKICFSDFSKGGTFLMFPPHLRSMFKCFLELEGRTTVFVGAGPGLLPALAYYRTLCQDFHLT